MKNTLDLLAETVRRTERSERDLSKALGYTPTALSTYKHKGHIPPLVAGQLAELLGEPVQRWIAIAAVEAAAPSKVPPGLKQRLLRAIA